MSPRVVSLLVALRDHGGRCCTPPVFVCEEAPEVGGHGWALLYAPPAFVCKGALEAGGGGRSVGCVGRLGSEGGELCTCGSC